MSAAPTYLPVFLDLRNRPCLVVGGGPIAEEKIDRLLGTGAQLTIVSPSLTPRLTEIVGAGKIQWKSRQFQASDMDAAFLVIAATGDEDVSDKIFDLSNKLNRLCNAVDDPEHCSFIFGAVVRRGPVQVAVSSSGCSPALARRIRDRIAEEILDENLGRLAETLGSWRDEIKRRVPGYKARKEFWEGVLDSEVPHLLAAGRHVSVEVAWAHGGLAHSEPVAHQSLSGEDS